jgi:hypothetical protein
MTGTLGCAAELLGRYAKERTQPDRYLVGDQPGAGRARMVLQKDRGEATRRDGLVIGGEGVDDGQAGIGRPPPRRGDRRPRKGSKEPPRPRPFWPSRGRGFQPGREG